MPKGIACGAERALSSILWSQWALTSWRCILRSAREQILALSKLLWRAIRELTRLRHIAHMTVMKRQLLIVHIPTMSVFLKAKKYNANRI